MEISRGFPRTCVLGAAGVSQPGQTVERHLSPWHSVQFHQPSATLYLAVYRPASPVYRLNGERLCNVKEQWIAVELAT